MKDGSDATAVCNSGGKTETVLHVPSSMDNVCLRDEPITSQCPYDDVNTDKLLPESTSTWGDFESFNEFTPQSEQFYYADESFCLDSFDTMTLTGEDYTETTDGQAKWDAFNLENVLQSTEGCESIFKMSFPAMPVSETSEDVTNLSTLMTSSNEEHLCKLIRTRLWLDCDHSQQGGDILPVKSGWDWPNSKGCRDLRLLLGTGAENFSDNGEETSDGVMITNIERFSTGDSMPPAGNRCLIQTKLDVVPGSKQGHIFSYQLFLKKSTDVPLPFLTFSGKKSFFSTNQLRFNF
ncbi:uncharacterized protein CLBA1-like [Pseudophryne corroboree]|uniref:uncharacterized protein CLBA1-like n=1 Tax=Pseudophryne corroboree TaxID=495146 RepID=UPI0030820A57